MSQPKYSLSAFFTKRWYGTPGALRVLTPFEFLYEYLSKDQKKKNLAQAESVGVPLIVVGNITVGGTGKTPTIIALTKFLQDKGLRVGVISRGYGRATSGLEIAKKDSDASHVGDEPFEILRNANCFLAVCEDREVAAKALVKRHQCEIILSDDGMQHYRMFRDKEILLVDGLRGFGNGHLLPVGPLRERVSRISSVDWILKNTTGFEESAAHKVSRRAKKKFRNLDVDAEIHLVPQSVVNVKSEEEFGLEKLSKLNNILALAGIANPSKFFRGLKKLGLSFETRVFVDHHEFTYLDLVHKGDILMTEKDAVKCEAFAAENAYFLRSSMHIPEAFLDDFWNSVKSLISQYESKS